MYFINFRCLQLLHFLLLHVGKSYLIHSWLYYLGVKNMIIFGLLGLRSTT